MKSILAPLAALFLLAACTPAEPLVSPGASAVVSPSPTVAACSYPDAVAAELGAPAATAIVPTFTPAPDVSGATPLVTARSPFDGDRFYFHPSEFDTTATLVQAQGGFATPSAGAFAVHAVILPIEGGAASSWSAADVDFGLNLRLDDSGFQTLIAASGGRLPGLFTAETTPTWRRIGGIAVGADSLYYQAGSNVAATLLGGALPFDFPSLAIAHHPSAASAGAAIGWTAGLGARPTVSYCVAGVPVEFTVVEPADLGIAEADQAVFATSAPDLSGVAHPLHLALAAVEVDGEHYVIARGLLDDAGLLVPASRLVHDEFQLAVWPSGTKR